MAPFVSIIIPAYNIGKLIKETISSVLVQTFADFELIVVDDGSTDNTAEVVKFFNDSRIIYHYQNNSGLPAKPRNTGARLAKGEYLAFLDHDDIWLPKKLERQIDVIKNNPKIGLISTNAFIMNGNEKTSLLLIKGTKSGYLDDGTFFPSNKVVQSTALVKKTVFNLLGGLNENPELKAIEDYDLWLRIYAQYPCYYINDCLAYYRMIASSTSGGKIKSILRELAHYQKYFASYGFSENINRSRHSHLLLALGVYQLLSGDLEWKKNISNAFFMSPDPRGLIRYLLTLLPYQLAILIYKLKRKLFQLIGRSKAE